MLGIIEKKRIGNLRDSKSCHRHARCVWTMTITTTTITIMANDFEWAVEEN